MTNHTPGPWFCDGPVIRGDADGASSVSVASVLDVAWPFGRRAGPAAQFNARLIAAAPDMLEALKAAQSLIEIIIPFDGEVSRMVRKAIAKADGGAA